METETLSNYQQQQSQERHVLDNVDINIPSHDDISNSLHPSETNEGSSGFFTEPAACSSIKTGNEESCDGITSSKRSDDKLLEIDETENTSSKSVSTDDEDNFLLEEQDHDDISSTEEINTLDNEEKQISDNNIQSSNDEDNINTIGDASESDDKETILQNNRSPIENEKAETNYIKENEENKETEVINEDLFNESKDLQKNNLEEKGGLEGKDTEENENAAEEMDIDDDFDPSLLCPDIAMEVEEAPVITNSDNLPVDGNKSPLLYDPVYSTYVDEMTGAEVTFNLSPEEHQMRQELYGENNPVQFTKIHCTACNVHLGSALDGQGNRFVHPLLKVLICKDCYHFYTSGEFEKDEDGSELYCRWCGQGGQVMCCSACEMVFCKKCIRINYGRKKLVEIRDSDDWFCFRCNPSQLTELRVHCAEFMEYVRREISRAATLENATSFMTTDYTQCCLAQKKKYVDPNANEPKKKKRKHVDPDYDPEMDKPSSSPTLEIQTPVPIQPKPVIPKISEFKKPQVIQGAVFRVGNTTFRPRTAISQVRPIRPVSVIQGGVNTIIRPQPSTPGFIKIMPSGIRATSSPRQPAQTFVSTAIRPQNSQPRPIRMANNVNNSAVKNEWFEKTVRAAARVNSNLSYTLTQLNRAQATASSVEALAVVHNRLQEILSASINSLIQIRKNLRAEFIAGIKNIRTPAKPTPIRPMPSTSVQDDDVIFVSPTTSPVPTPMAESTISNLSPSVTLTNSMNNAKRNTAPVVPTTTLQLIPTATVSNAEKPKSFLRVKSLSALQNVPSECITIPDDPVAPLFSEVLEISSKSITESEDGGDKLEKDDATSKESVKEKDETPSSEKKKDEESKKDKEDASEKSVEEPIVIIDTEKSDSQSDKVVDISDSCSDKVEDISDCHSDKVENFSFTDDTKDRPPLLEEMKITELKVHLVRSKEIDILIEKQSELLNGESTE